MLCKFADRSVFGARTPRKIRRGIVHEHSEHPKISKFPPKFSQNADRLAIGARTPRKIRPGICS